MTNFDGVLNNYGSPTICNKESLKEHDSELLDKVADMILSLPKKYIDNFDYVACALILNGLEKLKAR